MQAKDQRRTNRPLDCTQCYKDIFQQNADDIKTSRTGGGRTSDDERSSGNGEQFGDSRH